MDGTLTSGTPLREVGLASEFDVSRRTVQDALTVLAAEGLVRHERHRGSKVAKLSRSDVEDLYAVRLGLELMAARNCGRSPESTRQNLRNAYEELRIATSVGRARDIVRRDLDFHRAVVAMVESPRIDTFFGTIASEMRYALSVLESASRESFQRPQEALREHVAILEALLARDVGLSERLITDHVMTYRDRLVAVIEG